MRWVSLPLPQAAAALVAAGVVALCACGGGGSKTSSTDRATTANAPPMQPVGTPAEQVRQVAVAVFDDYFTKKDAADDRYYAGGVWRGPEGCWPCATGPAGLGAALWSQGELDDPAAQRAVVGTFDHAIATRQKADGSFGTGIDTAFFTPVLGTALMVLGDRIPDSTRRRWQRSLVRGAGSLERNDELTWYVNGNINLTYALTLFLTWRATGDTHWKRLYENQLSFATAPPAARWRGRGLKLRRTPGSSDGSDGRGFLTETGPGGTGYDPEYTQLALDVLTRFYVLSGDRRVLRLDNLLTNQALTGVNGEWNLLTTGTRHIERNRYVPFTTASLTVLGTLGGRDDLKRSLDSQLLRIVDLYRGAMTFTHPNMYRGVDTQLGTLLLASEMSKAGDLSS